MTFSAPMSRGAAEECSPRRKPWGRARTAGKPRQGRQRHDPLLTPWASFGVQALACTGATQAHVRLPCATTVDSVNWNLPINHLSQTTLRELPPECLTAPPTSSPLPTIRAAFAPVSNLAAAETYTRKLAHSHYENFSVVSLLLPSRLRQDFCNIYAFCRTADDLGDEVGDRDRSLECLANFKEQTRACYAGQASTAVFVALSTTIRKYDIPIQPFLDLIDAFEQDQRITPLRHLRPARRLLPPQRRPRRPARALHVRLPRPAAPEALRQDLHRASAHQFLAGCPP